MDIPVPLDELLGLIRKEVNPAVLEKARGRQAAVWEGRKTDYLPILLGESVIPERNNYPVFDLEEQFFDPAKMLYEQLWPVLGVLRSGSDSVPSVRVNFGTGFLATVFGLEQDIFPDKMPWLRRRLAKEDILKLTVEDLEPVAEKGLMPDCRRYIEFYRKRLNGTPVKIYLPDTQGPFDIAHLVLGDSIFTELYDDPEFVRHLLTLSAYVYRAASRIIKQWTGEPATGGCHGNGLYLSGCGVRACEDTTTLLSPDLIAVVAPFIQEALEPFNGWVHFCGSGQNLLDRILRLPAVKGVNFGNPEKYPWKEVIAQIVSAGRVYYGFAARNEKEPLSGYFERVLSGLKTKGNLIFIPAVNPDEPTGETVTLWRKAQDRCFGR